MKTAVTNILKSPALDLSRAEQLLFSQAIDLCLPLGLQNISSPLLLESDSVEDIPWSPQYRYLDGAFSGDSTSVPFTVAKIQKDCDKQDTKYDCENEPIKVALISDGARNQFPSLYGLFANCTGECRANTGSGLGSAYQPQVFAEVYPPDDDPGWVLYSNKSYTFSIPGKEDRVTPYLPSYVWRGNLTTADNPIWDIKAGTKVDFVMFAAAYPPEDYVIWPGLSSEYAWSEIYAQVSEEQASSTKELIETNPFIGTFFTPAQSPTEAPSKSIPPNSKKGKKGKKNPLRKKQKKKT